MNENPTLCHNRATPRSEVVITVVGELDIRTAGVLRERIGQSMGPRGTVVVIDAAAVTFIDCAGLRELLAARAKLDAAGRTLLVRAPSRPVSRLLELTGSTGSFSSALAA